MKMAKSLQKIFGQRGGAGGSGLPRGASWGMRLLGTAAVVGFGIYESMYTGEEIEGMGRGMGGEEEEERGGGEEGGGEEEGGGRRWGSTAELVRVHLMQAKMQPRSDCTCLTFDPCTVEGGHRAIIFSRISGVQQKIRGEGIHFRSVY